MERFQEQVVLITGAPGGLGSAQARRFASQGATIAINYLDIPEIAQQAVALQKELTEQYGGTHLLCPADISDPAATDAMVSKIIEQTGRIDVLVNNAGISINAMSWKYPEEAWQKVLGVNLTGAFHCIRSVLPHMRAAGYGRIVSISSVVGLTGAVGTAAYAACKAGLIGLTKTVAREVAGKGITVNCVAPGYINAGIIRDVPEKMRQESVVPSIPMGRLGEAADIASAVVYLGSPEAGYITGHVLPVDGGFAM